MGTDQFEDWKTQAEAAEILQCSQKTIARLAAQQKLQRGLRRVPRTEAPTSVPSWRRRGDPRRHGTGPSRFPLANGQRKRPWLGAGEPGHG